MQKLTQKQCEIIKFIREHSAVSGFYPTVREIASNFGIAIGTAQGHLKALVKKKVIEHTPKISRGIKSAIGKTLTPIPLLGSVQAGMPMEAIEDAQDYVYVDIDIVKSGHYFSLKVKGDSMSGSGILEGDTIVVRHQPTAEHNDTVVAMVDGEATVKKLYRHEGKTFLIATNPDYPNIESANIDIVGKVVCLTRDYK